MSTKIPSGVGALCLAVAVFALVGGLFWFVTVDRKPARAKAEAKEEWPYPECGACLNWLRENFGDPSSIEPLTWKKARGEGIYQGSTVVMLNFRGRNKIGALAIFNYQFALRGGQVGSGFDLDEWGERQRSPVP